MFLHHFQTLEHHRAQITSLSVAGNRLISSALDHKIILWDLQAAVPLDTVGALKNISATSLAFQGDVIAAGYEDGVVRLWDPRAPPYQLISQLEGNTFYQTFLTSQATVDL